MRQDFATRRRLAVCAVLAACAGLVACTESPTTASTAATIALAVSPNPAVPEPSANASYAWRAVFSVTVSDTSAVGATINSVSATLKQSSGGIVIVTGQSEAVQFVVNSGGNRVEGNAQTTIGFEVDYTLPSGGHEAVVDVVVAVTDDNGVAQSVTVRANLQ